MQCPICFESRGPDAPELNVFFEMPAVPVFCNVLHPDAETAKNAPRGEIRLGWCNGCGLIHNVDFDPALVEYAEGYENSLHCSPRFQAFAEELAARLIDKYELAGSEVVEIGAHRGEFLELLCADGRNHGVGYDPSTPEELVDVEGRNFDLSTEFFEPGLVEGELGMITSRHVLEHIRDPASFVRTMLAAAERGGGSAVYLEVPNGLWTLRDLGIWDIIYEHCSYFVPTSLRRLFVDLGAEPHIREAFGGQFLSAEVPAGDDAVRDEEEDARAIAELEGYVDAFAGAYADRLGYWRTQLAACADRGEGLAIWGAGSKGVTFLNLLGADAAMVRGVVDINPLKQGKFVSGTGHQIIGPEQVPGLDVQRVVVMNPLYVDEIGQQLGELGYQGTVEAIG